MLATEAPGLLFVILVPVIGLATAFAIGVVLWKVMSGMLRHH